MTATNDGPARRYHHGDLRRALVEAATALAEQGGTDGVVLREAARRVGVSPSAAYRHFPSRDGLLAAVGSAARERLVRRMLAASPGAPDLVFRATGLAYIEFALDEPGLFEVAFRPCPPGCSSRGSVALRRAVGRLDALADAGRLAVPRAGAEEPAWAACTAPRCCSERMIPPSERSGSSTRRWPWPPTGSCAPAGPTARRGRSPRQTADVDLDLAAELSVIVRPVAASVLGALVGLEREIHEHPAGMRTHLLVSLGSAGFTVLSIDVFGVDGDPGRVAAKS